MSLFPTPAPWPRGISHPGQGIGRQRKGRHPHRAATATSPPASGGRRSAAKPTPSRNATGASPPPRHQTSHRRVGLSSCTLAAAVDQSPLQRPRRRPLPQPHRPRTQKPHHIPTRSLRYKSPSTPPEHCFPRPPSATHQRPSRGSFARPRRFFGTGPAVRGAAVEGENIIFGQNRGRCAGPPWRRENGAAPVRDADRTVMLA